MRTEHLIDRLKEACSICEAISDMPASGVVRLVVEGHDSLVAVRHTGDWPSLSSTEQFQMMGLMAEVIASSGVTPVSLTTALVDDHFHLRIEPGGSELANVQQGFGNELIAGGRSNPLFHRLAQHIDRAHQVDFAVAFAVDSGVAMLAPYFEELLDRGGRLRLVVGDYFDVTEPSALRRFMDLKGNIERYVFETNGGSFHPKAWVFRGEDGAGTAIVGSSNLTRTALKDGVEWNLQSGPLPEDWTCVQNAFEVLLTSPNVKPLVDDWIDAYIARRQKKPMQVPTQAVFVESTSDAVPEPHDIQQQALDALEETRQLDHRSGLVVLATGLGKTWLSAFDSMSFKRILFVAHREEILSQAMSTFRRIRPDSRFGRYTGKIKEDGDILFASIQTLGRSEHLAKYDTKAFDYIVVDEFHHAAARSYRALLDHFSPEFLLGLTATPERTDGGDLLGLCGENLVFQCDVMEGIEAGYLVPFHYFGVPDEVDYEQIPWRSSRFDEEALTNALATKARAKNALEQYQKHSNGPTIAFCCSRRHANFMADYFASTGLKTASVHSGKDTAPRTSSLEALGKGELDVLFAVDMFNEGVDVPQIGTVMMLRPTESAILFLQQLGRGLRKADGKSSLKVIDYIGNHRSFLTKARTLLSASEGDRSLSGKLEELECGQFKLPEGCSITYELQVFDMLKAMLRQSSAQEEIEAFYRDFKLRNGVRPTASEMARNDFAPTRTGHGGWFDFVRDMGDIIPDEVMITHGDLFRLIEKAPFLDVDPLVVLKSSLRLLGEGVGHRQHLALSQMLAERWPETGEFTKERFEAGCTYWLMTPFFVDLESGFSLARADQTAALSDLILELVDWRMITLLNTSQPSPALGELDEDGVKWQVGPQLWQSYKREDIPALFGATFNPGNWNSGMVRVGKDLVLLTTLNKGSLASGNHYEDHFLSPTKIQWQSQSRTKQDSAHGLILSGQDEGASVYLFVRGEKLRAKKAAPFIFCGQPRFVSWDGEKPITINWELGQAVPDQFRRMLGVPAGT